MAYIHFDSKFVPYGFVIARERIHWRNSPTDCLIQSDWDFAGVASTIGWIPCKCGSSDGTINCKACNRTISDMLSEAYNYIRARNGKRYKSLDSYLGGQNG